MANVKSKVAAGVVAAALAIAAGLVKHFEGDYRIPYRDPVGILTVCWGHTGPDIVPGKRYTLAECEAFLARDLSNAERVVDSCIKVPLTAGQRGGLVSFAFNLGPGGKGVKDGLCYLKSGAPSTISRKFNAGDYAGGCAEFDKWNANKLRGLALRRDAEEAACKAN